MDKVDISLIVKSLLLVWLLLTLHNFVFNRTYVEPLPEVSLPEYKVKISDAIAQSELDNSETIALFDNVLPRKKTEPSELEAQATPVKVIDRTLLPNFARFDPDNQAGLVAIFEGDERFAVIQLLNYETKTSRYERLKVGESLGAFQLIEIGNNRALFNNNNHQLELTLFQAKSS